MANTDNTWSLNRLADFKNKSSFILAKFFPKKFSVIFKSYIYV